MTDRLAREHPETQVRRTPPKIPGVLDLEDKDSTPPAPQVPMPGESSHGVQASGFQEILEELVEEIWRASQTRSEHVENT